MTKDMRGGPGALSPPLSPGLSLVPPWWHLHLPKLAGCALSKGRVVVGSGLCAPGHGFNHVYGDQFSTSKQTSLSGIYITF